MHKRSLIAVIVLFILAGGIQAAEWVIDPVHSSVEFKVSHLVISRTAGEFRDFSGTIDFGDDLSAGSVEMIIQAASINTDDTARDHHLRSDEFLDVKKYPTLAFKSKKIVPGEGSAFKLVGDLTIKGVTKEVVFDCDYHGKVNDPWGSTRCGFSAETTINRQDFGVTWNKVLDSGGLAVGNDVAIAIEIEAVLKK